MNIKLTVITTSDETPEETSEKVPKTPGFEGIVTLVGLFLIYILKKK